MKKNYNLQRIGGILIATVLVMCTVLTNITVTYAGMTENTNTVYSSASKTTASGDSNESSGSGQSVALQVDTNSKAEIALAAGNTKVDYSEFEKELKEALKNRGIDEDRVSFVEAQGMASDSTSNFAWWKYDHVPNSKSASINDSSHIFYEKNAGSNSRTEGDLNYTSSSSKYHAAGGNHISSSSSNSMTFNGYGSYAYKDFYYLPDTQSTKKTIEFTLAEEPYDALDGVGFFVNTSVTGSYSSQTQVINGYLVFFQYRTSGYDAYGDSIKIYSLENVNAYKFHHGNTTVLESIGSSGSNVFGGTIKLIATCSAYSSNTTNMYRKVRIEIMPTYLQLWLSSGTTSSVYNRELSDSNIVTWKSASSSATYTQYPLTPGYDNNITYRGGFGPLISYQSHGCEKITSLTLSNLKMDSERVRSLTEIIRSTNWSEDKQSFLVNLNEDEIKDFSSEYTTGEIINRLTDDDITYIGWCGDKNYSASNVFVDGVGNGSALVNINGSLMSTGSDVYSKASRKLQVDEIARVIANKLAAVSQGSEYKFLTTDNFTFKATNATLNDGNWSVGYSKNSYSEAKNNISTYQDLSNASFALSGYYEVYYNGVTDSPKAKIRIHEAPVAVFTASIDSDTDKIIIKNKSYDPEFCKDISSATGSISDGIKSTKIEYRNLSASNPSWTTDAPSSVGSDTWMIRMTVTDADGVETNAVQQIRKTTSSEKIAPYGTFELSSGQYIKGIDSNVSITDKSYALDGSTDFTVNYTITGPSSYSKSIKGNAPGSVITIPLSGLNAGTYKVSMYATNGKDSAAVSKTFTVVNGFSVNYDANATDDTIKNVPSIQYKVENQNLTLSNIAPSRTGYTFAGWNTSKDGKGTTYKPGDIYKLNSDLTLYAQWLENFDYEVSGDYTADYDSAYHKVNINVKNPSTGYKITYKLGADGQETQEPIQIKDAGKYTIYFTVSKDGFQTISSSRNIVINKLNLTASLTDAKVSYDGNPKELSYTVTGFAGSENVSNSGITPVVTYYTDAECTNKTTHDNSGALTEGAAPVETGTYYAKLTIADSTNYNATASEVAKLEILKYTVTFDNNGHGTQTSPIENVVSGDTIKEPERPTDEDYYFMGWYKEASCESIWDFANDTVNDGDVTLYAKWQLKSSFEANWTDKDGNEHFGSLDDALKYAEQEHEKDPSSKTDINIQNDVTINDDKVLPEGTNLTVKNPNKLTIGENGSITVPKGSSLNLEEGSTLDNNGNVKNDGEFNNDGTFNNNGAFGNDGSFKNGGTVSNTGTVDNNGDIKNDGDIQNKEDADFNNNGKLDNSGTLGNEGNLNNGENGTINNTGTVDNTGDIKNDGDIKNNKGSDFNNKGKLDNNGTLGNEGNLNNGENGTVNNTGTVDNTGDIKNDGNIQNKENSDFNNNGKLDNNGTLGNEGSINNGENGTVNNNGTVDNTGDIKNDGDIKNNRDSDFNNNGKLDNNGTLGNEGSLNNGENGSINNTGTVDNTGDIKNDGEIQNKENSDFNNNGKLDNNGTLGNEGSLNNGENGIVNNNGTVDNDGEIKNDGDIKNNKDSDFNNNGKLDNSGTLGNEGSLNNGEQGTVNNNGTVENSGDIKNDGEIQNKENADFNNNGKLDNTGTLGNEGNLNNGENGTISNAGTVDNTGAIKNDGDIKNNKGSDFNNNGKLDN
ncbi:MAG: InlB B-repeat-containing protein, partial [Lachnospira sp.]|nr:InlB B-repeat-containing protein [Lachnospira sp.]